jgi:hypothetical protein
MLDQLKQTIPLTLRQQRYQILNKSSPDQVPETALGDTDERR